MTRVDQNEEKRQPSYIADRIEKWCSHFGKQFGSFLKKLSIEIPCDPAIPFLDIYVKKNWNHMFTQKLTHEYL